MPLNQPAKALLTATFLAAAGAQSAQAVDCQAMLAELNAQYTVFEENDATVTAVSTRCRTTAASPGVQAWQIQQCNQDYQFVTANRERVNQNYTQNFNYYNSLCRVSGVQSVERSGPVVTEQEAEQIGNVIGGILGAGIQIGIGDSPGGGGGGGGGGHQHC